MKIDERGPWLDVEATDELGARKLIKVRRLPWRLFQAHVYEIDYQNRATGLGLCGLRWRFIRDGSMNEIMRVRAVC